MKKVLFAIVLSVTAQAQQVSVYVPNSKDSVVCKERGHVFDPQLIESYKQNWKDTWEGISHDAKTFDSKDSTFFVKRILYTNSFFCWRERRAVRDIIVLKVDTVTVWKKY